MNNVNKIWRLLGLILAVAIISCGHHSKIKVSNLYLYRRDWGSNNGKESYIDCLAITNYQAKTITVDSFVKIAQRYIDTIKSDKPVRHLVFLGRSPGDQLPDPNPDYYSDQVKCYIIAIRFFDDSLSKDQKPLLRGIAIWKNGESTPLIDLDRMMPNQNKEIDSLINSKNFLY